MRRVLLLLAVLLAQAPSSLPAQRKDPASKRELSEISERGKQLFAYEMAARQASDALLALKPDKASVSQYVGRPQGDRWVIAFGRLAEKRDKFLVAYEAVQGATPAGFSVNSYNPPREDAGFLLNAAKALETARTDFKEYSGPVNTAVLPASKDRFFVYVLPAQTKDSVLPQGADVRYLISKDGSTIVERRQMHEGILDATTQSESEVGFHIAREDIPEDSDVYYVLMRNPRRAEWILAPRFVYVIRPDASIQYLMKSEDFLKLGTTLSR